MPTAPASLVRLRWAVRGGLTLGVAASVTANILHANPNPISQAIAAWPPLALLITVELISRVPTHRRWVGRLRFGVALAIALIAFWVSYWHMAGVAARYGETDAAAAYLLPLSVDGLVIVASISLVEIAGRIRADLDRQAAGRIGAHQTTTHLRPTNLHLHREPSGPQCLHPQRDSARHPRDSDSSHPAPDERAIRRMPSPHQEKPKIPTPKTGHPTAESNVIHPKQPPEKAARLPRPGADAAPADELTPAGTRQAVAYWCRRDPLMHPADIAARIGRSERTVRRYLQTAATTN